MAKYTAEQKRNAAEVLKAARRNGATAMERRAAMETILVESNARHLNHGDRDSVGAFQQRPSQGWGPRGEGIGKDADQFFAAARKLRGKYKQAGQLAQAVQRSAFPERYNQRRGDAVALEHAAGGGGASLGQAREPRANISAMADDGAVRRLQVVANRRARRGASTSRIDAMVVASQAAVAAAVGLGAQARREGGSAPASGKSANGKAGDIKELFYDPMGGWDNGQPIGAIGGHSDHVHVGADPRRQKWLQQKAKQHGLTITSTTGGKHAAGSLHYSDQAFDAAGTPEAMAAFTRDVRRKYGLR